MLRTKQPDPKKARQYFLDKMSYTTGPVELDHWRLERHDIHIVDVRRAEDYAKGHIPGAVNLPKEKWSSLAGLNKEETNILYCYSQTCHLAPEAAVLFTEKGYPVMEMEGGFEAWQKNDLSVESTPKPENLEVISVGDGR